MGGGRRRRRALCLQRADPRLYVRCLPQANHGGYGLGPWHRLVCAVVRRVPRRAHRAAARLDDGPLEHSPGGSARHRRLRDLPFLPNGIVAALAGDLRAPLRDDEHHRRNPMPARLHQGDRRVVRPPARAGARNCARRGWPRRHDRAADRASADREDRLARCFCLSRRADVRGGFPGGRAVDSEPRPGRASAAAAPHSGVEPD